MSVRQPRGEVRRVVLVLWGTVAALLLYRYAAPLVLDLLGPEATRQLRGTLDSAHRSVDSVLGIFRRNAAG